MEVEGRVERAVAYPELCGPLLPGTRVLLNTTSAALRLGTGGVHFIIAVLDEEGAPEPFPGREAGHIMRLRYTPLQHRVRSAEEEGSPHRERVLGFKSLARAPVLAAELHSQAATAAIAARAARPEIRIAWVQLDTAALPLGFSRLVARLRADGVLDATVTISQGFGGDYEAVNVYTGLITAAAAADADLILVTQGPGNVGTGTSYGFSGLALAEALHAADLLGGTPILAPRMSEADPRERHRGVSHHTRTLLRCLRVPVRVPFPAGTADIMPIEPGAEPTVRHTAVAVQLPDEDDPLARYEESLSTMGRKPGQDRVFFKAAAAAGHYAAMQCVAREQE